MAFQKTKTLNRIQSIVFETAYKSNENLLICAPTGAGKTNIAMLCVLRELNQHILQGVIKKDEFKVIVNRRRWSLAFNDASVSKKVSLNSRRPFRDIKMYFD